MIVIEEIFIAGGCFWGVEEYYKRLKGVIDTNVGYANGHTINPTYAQICNTETGFAETVRIQYDPNLISSRQIMDHLFRIIDPTSLNKQAGDIGTQYRTGIFYTNPAQQIVAMDYINSVKNKYDKPIVVEVEPIDNYYEAEDYHQEYIRSNPSGYCHVNFNVIKEEEKR